MNDDQTHSSQVGGLTIFCNTKRVFHITGLNKANPKSVSGYKSLAKCAIPTLKQNKIK